MLAYRAGQGSPSISVATHSPTATPVATASPSPSSVVTSSPSAVPTPNAATIGLPVKRLNTSYTADGQKDGAYPTSLSVALPARLAASVGAYGTAGLSFLAPLGWTGTGSVGTDGYMEISMYPVNNPPHSLEMKVDGDPACFGCALDGAAAYFPNGKQWEQDNGFPVPKDLPTLATDTLVTPQLVHYTQIFTADGGTSNGYAYIGMKNGNPVAPFLKVEFRGFDSNPDLTTFLLKDFLSRQKLN